MRPVRLRPLRPRILATATRPRATALLLLLLASATLLAGCGPAPSPRDEPVQDARAAFVDWDLVGTRVDRTLLLAARDFAIAQNLAPRDPARTYREAVAYAAPRDSIGLIPFLTLGDAHQERRRQLARPHRDTARRVVIGTLHRYWNDATRGAVPDLDLQGNGLRPQGIETAVTTALHHLTIATGLDPTDVAAWRDLAYFRGAIGDRDGQHRALTATLAALDMVDPLGTAAGDLARIRRDTLLDLAWLARASGQPRVALGYLDHAAPWLELPSPERDDRTYEAGVLRGLALAEAGHPAAAVQQARSLPRAVVVQRTLRGTVREDLRWRLDPPDPATLGLDRAAWPRVESDFGRRWVQAVAQAHQTVGDLGPALWRLGPAPTHLDFPPRLAARYWQDRGDLCVRAGRLEEALHCYEWAALARPYVAFFPVSGSRARGMLASGEGPHRYYTGYGLFFLQGDRSAFTEDAGLALARPH
jgi:tetratricopeptide (TPR) repeat protein